MKTLFTFWICILLVAQGLTQTIGTFNSVSPGVQTQNLILPSTHTFQRIIKTGDALALGGTLGGSLDFTGYVPTNGSSIDGRLSISSETTPAEVAILNVNYNSTSKLWTQSGGGKVNFPSADIGGTTRFCSGTVTPANTIMVCEEAVTAGDVNADGYEDHGWVIEINPVTKMVVNQDNQGGVDKIWKFGRQSHENVVIKSDQSVVYWGADANPTGYLYKFIPTVPGIWTDGNLYVLVTSSALGTGTWVQIANDTKANLNNTVTNSTNAGAYNFNGIEDCEIGPDGKIYFAAKGPGVIYRFTDLGNTVNNLEVFVASINYDVDGAGPFTPEPWGIGNDNLAFDPEGNLWVLQDGSRNHIWVVGPSHTASNPAVRLFARTPAGSEPTGITFTPDAKFLFLSFQHPGANTISQIDASGTAVIFNTHTTVVIARKENLGTCPTITGLSVSNITSTSAKLSWNSNSSAVNYDVDYRIAGSNTWINWLTGTTNSSETIIGLTPATNYEWRVRANCGFGTGNYGTGTFSTFSDGCPGIYDNATNNAIAGAATIPMNTDIQGLIPNSSDIDYYKFINASSGSITLTLTNLPANYNLSLHNTAGTQLAISQNNGLNNEMIVKNLVAGNYYAKVFPKGNAKHATLCYTLQVQSAAQFNFSSSDINTTFQVFPNPVVDEIQLEGLAFDPEFITTVQVMDLKGNILLNDQLLQSNQIIYVSHLAAGMYLLFIQNTEGIQVQRFVKL